MTPTRRQAILALIFGTGYIYARPTPAAAQSAPTSGAGGASQAAAVMRTLRFPLDGIDALVYSYRGSTVSLTPKDIMDALAPSKLEDQ